MFFFQWERRREGGEGGKSLRRTGEAGSGLRWRGGDGTDINPSNACLSLSPSPLSLFQVSGSRGGNTRIHYFSELCAAITRDLFVCLLAEFIYFLVLVCVKDAANYRPPPNSTGD